MSWLFSQALVEEYSGENSSGGEPSAPSSGNPIPQAYCASDKMTAFSRLSRYGMTFAPLMVDHGADVLTWFLAGFPARTSVQQERVRESTESAAECGGKWPASLARFDPDTCSWRTHQCLLFEDLTECLETFPRWGMMRGGELWELTIQEEVLREKDSGLLPSPVCQDSRHAISRHKKAGDHWKSNLGEVIASVYEEESANGSRLNPDFVEWLMLWPVTWTDLKPLATDKFRQWLLSHGGF